MTDQSKDKRPIQDQSYSSPVETERDGRVKATIWKQYSEQGDFYTASVSSMYQDKDGQIQDGNSFTDINMLKLAEVSRRTYMRMRELKREDQKQSRSQTQDRKQKRYPSIKR